MDKLFKDMNEVEQVLVGSYADFLMILDYLNSEGIKPTKKMASFANAITNFSAQIIHDYLRQDNEDTGKAD